MEYKLVSTVNGPAVMGEDEIVFFHQFGALADYVDSDPQFFDKAQAFIIENMREESDLMIRSLSEDVVGNDWMTKLNHLYHAAVNLQHFQRDVYNNQGFPGI
jgi:hypothetical protein